MAHSNKIPFKRTRQRVSSDSDSDVELVPNGGWSARWLIFEGVSEERPLSALTNPFRQKEGFRKLGGDPKSFKRLRNGSWLVECSNRAQSETFRKCSAFLDCPIRVSLHKTLNSSKGVIRCSDLQGVTEEEILEGLKSQGVTGVHRVLVRRGGDRVPSHTFFLTFNVPHPPEIVKVGYLKVRVVLYVPSPLRCFKCQKFGHVRDRCPGEEVCGRCSKASHQGECQDPAHCVNCGGKHPSSSKDCPSFVLEKQIQRVKTERKISFFEARKIVKDNQPTPGKSYAQTAAPKPRPAGVSVGCQTDDSPLFVFRAPASAARVSELAPGGGSKSATPPVQRKSSTASVGRTPPGGGSSLPPPSPSPSPSPSNRGRPSGPKPTSGGGRGRPVPPPKPTDKCKLVGMRGSASQTSASKKKDANFNPFSVLSSPDEEKME